MRMFRLASEECVNHVRVGDSGNTKQEITKDGVTVRRQSNLRVKLNRVNLLFWALNPGDDTSVSRVDGEPCPMTTYTKK